VSADVTAAALAACLSQNAALDTDASRSHPLPFRPLPADSHHPRTLAAATTSPRLRERASSLPSFIH
jgi:hypothetical protein